MATSSVENPNEIDHLSNLPDHLLVTILSLLTTRIAGRTSVLCHRFRNLWEACSSLDLAIRDLPSPEFPNFVAMAERALLCRNPSYLLLNLRIDLRGHYYAFDATQSSILVFYLLAKASSLGLHHLTMRGCSSLHFTHIIPVIFSIHSLRSLSLDCFFDPLLFGQFYFPSGNSLPCLESLFLYSYDVNQVKLERLISEFSSLQELCLNVHSLREQFSISSQTIRKLELNISGLDTVTLSLPSLEFLRLCNLGQHLDQLPYFHGEIPLLRKATIVFYDLHAEDVNAIAELLNYISHVEELSLYMRDNYNKDVKDPFPILLKPGKSTPNFLNLKHFDVTACFHRYNFEAVVTMLHHSPALESLNLVHQVTWQGIGRKRKDWGSTLPRNSDGNKRYAYFRNLHLRENREGLIELITKKLTEEDQPDSDSDPDPESDLDSDPESYLMKLD